MLESGWAIFVEAQRHSAGAYPPNSFPDVASALVDAERRAQFEEASAHYEVGPDQRAKLGSGAVGEAHFLIMGVPRWALSARRLSDCIQSQPGASGDCSSVVRNALAQKPCQVSSPLIRAAAWGFRWSAGARARDVLLQLAIVPRLHDFKVFVSDIPDRLPEGDAGSSRRDDYASIATGLSSARNRTGCVPLCCTLDHGSRLRSSCHSRYLR